MAGKPDILAVVEASYRVNEDDSQWLEMVLDAAGAHLADGLGYVATFYDREAHDPTKIMAMPVISGMDPRIILTMRSEFEGGSDADRAKSLRKGGAVVPLTRLCGGKDLATTEAYGALVRELGFVDVIGVRAANPDGTGVFIGAPVRRAPRPRIAFEARWSRLAAHIAAGLRLQRGAATVAADRASAAAAVMTPGGRVLSASGEARDALGSLRDAALRIDRARTRSGRRDPDAALDGWKALVEGHWSLVDHFESDGKRFVIALENAPHAPDPRALAPKERAIIHFAAMGHSNKLIAYQLGIPEGTVATRVQSIARKLRVRSRAEMIERYHTLQRARFDEVDVPGGKLLVGHAAESVPPDVLTAAELDVARRAASGRDNASIAKARGCSPRTVANLLQSVYRKLDVRSRAELTRRLASGA